MKQAWNRLGTPDAISWVVVVLASVQIIAGSITAPFVDISGRFAEFLGARLVSLLVALVVLGIGKLLLVKLAKENPKPWLALFIFAVSTVGLTVTMNWMLIITGFTDEWNIPRRIIIALPGFFAIQILSAVLSAYARESSRRNEELAATAAMLVSTREQAAERILERKSALITAVKREVELSLLGVGAGTNATTALRSLIDDVVRPMSYQLSREIAPQSAADITVPETRVSWTSILSQAVRGNPSHPVTATLWLGLLLGSFLMTGFGLLGFLATLVHVAFAYLTLTITRVLWPRLPEQFPDWARMVLFSLVVLFFTFVSTPIITMMTGHGLTVPSVFIAWFVLSLFITWTVTLVMTVNQTLRDTYIQLSTTVVELKREVIQLNNELRLLQKNVSRVLHGPVQEAISASLARLQGTSAGIDEATLLADAQHRVQQALLLIDQPVESRLNLRRALEELVELWDEVVRITVAMDDRTTERVEQDSFASTTLIELILEACGNAIRHGQAKNIRVSVSVVKADDSIQLTVENDGKPLTAEPTSGLGSQFFDEMCLEWSRVQSGEVVLLEALIPLA